MSNGAVPKSNACYQTYPSSTGTDSACTGAMYVLPPSFTYDAPNSVAVDNVYLPSATPPAPSNDDFSVTWSPSPPTTTADSTLTVNVLNANQWKCAETAREALRENFAALATALDAMEYPASSAVLVPGATALIMRRVAEIIPAPLRESLFYYHGFSTGLGAGPACPSRRCGSSATATSAARRVARWPARSCT